MTSVRESLDVVSRSVSIKELAYQRNESFPLSLREFVGAPPSGRMLRKVISLDFLQRKFDVFFNERVRPLFQIRLDSKERKYGQSALTVAMLDSVAMSDPNRAEYDHDHPVVLKELAGPGEVLELPGVIYGTHRFYFQDVNSDGLALNVVPGQLVGIEIAIHFETEGGIEIKVEDFNAHDIDFDAFNIKLKMEFGSRNGLIDLVGFIEEIEQAINSATITSTGLNQVMLTVHFRGEVIRLNGPSPSSIKGLVKEGLIKRFINTDVSVNVDFLPDGVVANKVEKNLNSKILEALKSSDNRDALNRMVTRWLVGGDFYVVGVASDDQSLIIDYIIPPGQLEPFPENPQPPLNQGLLANIDHIVVLMMENRSFDHMLGYLSKEGGGDGKKRTDIDGLLGGETNADGKGRNYSSFPLSNTTFNESPDHSHQPVENQINGGKMNGFVTSFAAKFPEIDNPGKVMGYHTAAHVPVYDALAREFLICQRWFAAHPGPTFCNRFYTLTGRLNRDAFGRFEFDNFTGNDFKPVPTRTLFDHLSDHGVSWHFYEHRYCSLRLYARYTTDTTFIVDANDPAKGFFASAQAGTLPAVSFIDPNFIDEPDGQDNDDGAPSDIAAGQNLIGRVVNAGKLRFKCWKNRGVGPGRKDASQRVSV